MLHRGVSVLCLCIAAMHLLQAAAGEEPIVDPELRAHLEAHVMSSLSLKDIEAMVENDERVRNAPKSKLIIIPRGKNADGEDEALVIQRKPKKPQQRTGDLYQIDDFDFDSDIRRLSSFEKQPSFQSGFERRFSHDGEDFPTLLKLSDLESAASTSARDFYESIVGRVMERGGERFGLGRDPMDVLELASASEEVPQYKPRFDYGAYARDSTETKLRGKPYWKDAPERKDEMIDENGCRTVIKKIVDPEDEKKSSSDKAKSVVITKECEYPDLNGPDAKITQATPLRRDTSRSEYSSYEPETYADTRPEELNFKPDEARDPLAPDYIDTMLEKHFKSFPGFSNPLSSFKGYQERFKLRSPEGLKDVKPTVGVRTYEYSSPESGFDDEDDSRQSSVTKESLKDGAPPKKYEHHYHYDYPERSPRKPSKVIRYDDERDDVVKTVEKSPGDSKDPKMMKKSFAYYRKDNPKDDPNDHQYAEEYAQGNFRSFSSSYDSEKDGPKKKQ